MGKHDLRRTVDKRGCEKFDKRNGEMHGRGLQRRGEKKLQVVQIPNAERLQGTPQRMLRIPRRNKKQMVPNML